MLPLFLALSLAHAGVLEDLGTAANKDLPNELRRAAMDRLETSASYDDVVTAAKNDATRSLLGDRLEVKSFYHECLHHCSCSCSSYSRR